MRPPEIRLFDDELIIDSFAGGGGASTGIMMATGRSPDIAINHDIEAISMHAVNHPETVHYVSNVWDVDPVTVCAGRKVGLMWLSPDCCYFSRARGGAPFRDRNKARRRRGLANLAVRWAKAVRPRVICLENVPEWLDWCPLGKDGLPDWSRAGFSFRRWLRELEGCGYKVEWRELRACDYGAPTTRKRLFLVARCDGLPIVWPSITHGPGRASPFRTAAECIDWTIPCLSIFGRKKPMAEATLARIARGVKRYVIETAEPFIIQLAHHGNRKPNSIHEPMPTITGAHRGEHALVVPALIHRGNGEREGQEPRIYDPQQPHPTVVAGGVKTGLVAAFLARHYGGNENDGASLQMPLPTITTVDHHARVDVQLTAAPADHRDEVRAFLIKYYGTDGDPQLRFPMHTVTTKDRFGVVLVQGREYVISDIQMRMLAPRELYLAQGFPVDYQIDKDTTGKPFTKTAQVRMCGNSVSPPAAAAVVAAQFSAQAAREVA